MYVTIGRGQGEIECRAMPGRGLCPDFAAMALDDPLYRGQANTAAGIFISEVQADERFEQMVGMGHIKTYPVVPDKKGAAYGITAKLYSGRWLTSRVFQGITEQVLQAEPQQRRIAAGSYIIGNDYLDVAVSNFTHQGAGNFQNKVAQVQGLGYK